MAAIEPAAVFVLSFAVALALQGAFALARASRDGKGWTALTTLSLAEFALNAGFITASSIMGALLFASPLTLTVKCVIGLMVLIPLSWLTLLAFRWIETRRVRLEHVGEQTPAR